VPSFNGLIEELRPFAEQLLTIAGSNGLSPRVTSQRRSFSTQARLYKLYLAGRSAYPVAPPGTSAHEFGYAFDLIVTPLEYLNALGSLWESWGGKWGGRFRDPVHFEYPGFTAPVNPRTNQFLMGLYKAANLASFVATPLEVEETRPVGYSSLASEIEHFFGL